jgi:hypothetical protein
MDSHVSKAGWDIILFGIPLIALLIFGFFRLDETFTSRKRGTPLPPRPEEPTERRRKRMRSDPDGRPWDDQ